jgi:probable rRNA maturation factor
VRQRCVYVSPWRIDVTVRDGVLPTTSVAVLCRAIARALSEVGAPEPASIGLVLSDDAELADLNRTHMGADGPTDVLSFPLLPPSAYPPHAGGPGDAAKASAPTASAPTASAPTASSTAFVEPPGRRRHLGDVVVSVERAIEQAAAGRGGQTGDVRWSPGDELRLLVTHGTLHVCGWDHAEPAEEAAMRHLEQRLLAEGR